MVVAPLELKAMLPEPVASVKSPLPPLVIPKAPAPLMPVELMVVPLIVPLVVRLVT